MANYYSSQYAEEARKSILQKTDAFYNFLNKPAKGAGAGRGARKHLWVTSPEAGKLQSACKLF
jgi:hypothetical protein